METLFTKIIQGKIPCYKIAENEDFFAFLDIYPNAKGHTLVVPKKPVDKLFDLDLETYQELFLYARKVAEAIEKVVACDRVGISVIGLEVPHAHVHLIPLNSMQDANFSKPKIALTPKAFEDLAAAISQQLEQ
jgi:histidine triad (HIT) family protein